MGLPASKADLLVLGVHLKSEAYPNVLYRLQDLQRSGSFHAREINVPAWTLGTLHMQGRRRLLRNFWRAVWAHLAVLGRYLAAPRPRTVYVPYPAIGVLFLLSLLPRGLRPRRTVADVFISAYDTAVNDRHLLDSGGLAALLLKAFERRAYRTADAIVADTPENADFLRREFSLASAEIAAIPLSTNESNFRPASYRPGTGPCRVLFFGTFVPLHGAETIAGAIALLGNDPKLTFRLIGDGQSATDMAVRLQRSGVRVEWERGWQPASRLAAEIGAADICLGVFGAGAKAQRVCPLKLYACAAVGRTIVTADSAWSRRVRAGLDYVPFECVPAGDAEALAASIRRLAADPERRAALASASRRFYEEKLSNRLAMEKLTRLLRHGG